MHLGWEFTTFTHKVWWGWPTSPLCHSPLLLVTVRPGRPIHVCVRWFGLSSTVQSKNDNTSRQEPLTSSFSVFKFRPSPFFERQAFIGAPHANLPKHLYYKATDWDFSIVISWAKISSILLRNRSQDPTQDVMHRTAVRELAKYACGLPRIPTLELNQAQHPHDSFLSTLRA